MADVRDFGLAVQTTPIHTNDRSGLDLSLLSLYVFNHHSVQQLHL